MQIYRSGDHQDVQPSHTGGDVGGAPGTLHQSMARRWLSAAKFIAAPVIIIVVASLLFPVIVRARRPGLEVRCMGKLRQIAGAIGMYSADYGGAYPLRSNWHWAIRDYIDSPHAEERVIPGSPLDPLKCASDPSDYPVSYLYLDRTWLGYSKANLDESVTPLAVDEYFHEHVTLAYYDGHVERLDKQLWLHRRNRQWEIRRDLDHPASFSYEPVPGSVSGPQAPIPEMDRTEMYIWPKF